MVKPVISPDFTVEDIHKIREYHYEITKDMPFPKRAAFYREGAKEFQEYLTARKRQKETMSQGVEGGNQGDV